MQLQRTEQTPDFAGVSRPLDEFEPALVQGAHFRSLDVPETAAAGDTISITGVLHYDNVASPISKKDCRVVAESPAFNQPEMSDIYSLAHCQTSIFNFNIPATAEEGETVAITLRAQNETVAGWQTTERRGPFRVKVVSSSEKATSEALNYLPYAAIGGAAGFATAINGSPGEKAVNTLVGAGAGVVGNEALKQADFRFNFPTIPVLATAGLLGAGAFLLGEATDFGIDVRDAPGAVRERASRALPD